MFKHWKNNLKRHTNEKKRITDTNKIKLTGKGKWGVGIGAVCIIGAIALSNNSGNDASNNYSELSSDIETISSEGFELAENIYSEASTESAIKDKLETEAEMPSETSFETEIESAERTSETETASLQPTIKASGEKIDTSKSVVKGSVSNSTPESNITVIEQPTVVPSSEATVVEQPVVIPSSEATVIEQPTTEQPSQATVSIPSASNNSADYNFNTYDNTEQQNTTAQYVLNTSSMKIHYPQCRSVPKISPANYSTSNLSVTELLAQGYSTCGICFK